MTYDVRIQRPARRAIAEKLPIAVATAVLELVEGALAEDPHRVGKRCQPPFEDLHVARRGTYLVLYTIDDDARVVNVLRVTHRRDAYRSG